MKTFKINTNGKNSNSKAMRKSGFLWGGRGLSCSC